MRGSCFMLPSATAAEMRVFSSLSFSRFLVRSSTRSARAGVAWTINANTTALATAATDEGPPRADAVCDATENNGRLPVLIDYSGARNGCQRPAADFLLCDNVRPTAP